MFVRIGTPYRIIADIKNSNGGKVTDATVTAIIKDTINNKFFNGMFWVDSQVELIVEHILNGVYAFEFIPDLISNFEISINCDAYNYSKVYSIQSVKEDIYNIEWPLKKPYIVNVVKDENKSIQVSVMRKSDGFGYSIDDGAWLEGGHDFKIPLVSIGDVLRTSIVFPTLDEYEIKVIDLCNKQEVCIYNIKTVDRESVSPIIVNNKTLLALDGTDTTVIDNNKKPVAGVKISAYNSETKALETVSQTDLHGEWQLILKPGKYFFCFEKEGYISVSFERTVSA